MSCNTDLFKSYNTVRSRPESCNTVCPLRAVTRQGALMSITPNFCCDETKNRGAYTHVTDLPIFTLLACILVYIQWKYSHVFVCRYIFFNLFLHSIAWSRCVKFHPWWGHEEKTWHGRPFRIQGTLQVGLGLYPTLYPPLFSAVVLVRPAADSCVAYQQFSCSSFTFHEGNISSKNPFAGTLACLGDVYLCTWQLTTP